MSIVICLINQKGGCGKSSTCFHLAGAFVGLGMNVLVIDADPQGSLSQGFLGSAVVEELAASETLAALYAEDVYLSQFPNLVRATEIAGISVCPANQFLSAFNTPSPETVGMDQFLLRDFLQAQSQFDLVLIDCPPNLYRCSWTAMVAADYAIIPVPPEDFGTQGLPAVHQAIDQVRALNPSLRRLGHLVTRYDRRLLVHQSYEARLRALYSELVFDTVLPEASAFKVSIACRRPVEQHNPKSVAAELTRQLSREILDHIHRKKTHRQVT